MSTALQKPRTSADLVFQYHERTKHRLSKYAAGPETFDWTAQPNPYREFAGSPRILLPLSAGNVSERLGQIYQPGGIAPVPLSIESVGSLLQLSMGLSAWKQDGPDLWALRVNPSSGNLHPTEAYVLCREIDGIDNGIYHYVSGDHALEQRCAGDPSLDSGARLWIALSSIHWREAWKYGERAFRYCQHDVGHAIGALRFAAGALGWTLRVVRPYPHDRLAQLLGLDREEDFRGAEKEDPDVLLEVFWGDRVRTSPDFSIETWGGTWAGKANVLDPHPMYRWPVIHQVAAATQDTAVSLDSDSSNGTEEPDSLPLNETSPERAVDVILKRRSAQRLDPAFRMSADVFHHLMDCLLVRRAAPWDVWDFAPRIHLMIFIHRVDGLEPGLYAFVRRHGAEKSLRRALDPEFLWQRPNATPRRFPFFLLQEAQCRQAAKTVSCHQAIASDGCFSVAMLSEFEGIVASDPWRYRQLHWEAGLIGQVLYLEAEAAGLRGTGIGCYFDDPIHEILGIGDTSFASLYHFTVGSPILDERILTLPPYPERH